MSVLLKEAYDDYVKKIKTISLNSLTNFLKAKGFKKCVPYKNISWYQLRVDGDDIVQINVPDKRSYSDFNGVMLQNIEKLMELYKKSFNDIVKEINEYREEPKRKVFSSDVRLFIYNKMDGHCAYCGKKIDIKDMQVDHIIAIERGGNNDLDNLLPSCRTCNFYKSTYTIDEFRHQLGLLQERLEKVYIYRLSKLYGLIEEKPHQIEFYFEKKNKGEID